MRNFVKKGEISQNVIYNLPVSIGPDKPRKPGRYGRWIVLRDTMKKLFFIGIFGAILLFTATAKAETDEPKRGLYFGLNAETGALGVEDSASYLLGISGELRIMSTPHWGLDVIMGGFWTIDSHQESSLVWYGGLGAACSLKNVELSLGVIGIEQFVKLFGVAGYAKTNLKITRWINIVILGAVGTGAGTIEHESTSGQKWHEVDMGFKNPMVIYFISTGVGFEI